MIPASDDRPVDPTALMGVEGPNPKSSLRLRSRIIAGLVLVVPIWFTYVVVSFVFRLMRDASLWLIEAWLASPMGESLLARWDLTQDGVGDGGLDALPLPWRWAVWILAVLLTVGVLYVLGAVTTNVVGRRIVRMVEALVERVPFVTVIYHASKNVLETLTGEGTHAFKRVVLVPFPNKDTYSVGFVTCVTRDRAGHELYTVFVATAPNPTTGFVFVIRPSEVIELNWSIEEAIKVVMSGGVLTPERVPLPPERPADMPPHARDAEPTGS